MGTRSAIGVMHGNKAKVVYCHWDGYLEHNGRILLEHYDSAKANHLVALGGLSSLGVNVEIPEGVEHTFDKPAQGVCSFYGRDRGEEGNEYIVCFSDTEMFDHFEWCEFFYIMKDGQWYVSQGQGWSLLADAIADLDIAKSEDEQPTVSVMFKNLIGVEESE